MTRHGEPPQHGGNIEVICGPMFSGKTEELIRRLRRAQIARQRVVILKPFVDTRYDTGHLVSHSDQRIPSVRIEHSSDILHLAGDAEVVGIDEAQFLDDGLVEVCERLADDGKRVIVAGLDMDFRGQPFDPMPQLLARAEYITKALAICVVCGAPAARSQRLSHESGRIVLGSTDVYEARCRMCYEAPEEEPDDTRGPTRRSDHEADSHTKHQANQQTNQRMRHQTSHETHEANQEREHS